MQKQAAPIIDADHSGFFWVGEPSFTPSEKNSGVDDCVAQEFSTPRAGELRTLLEDFLENIIDAVNATAGVVRLLSPDGCTLEVISSSGLSAELQEEAEQISELECEAINVSTLGLSILASEIGDCDMRSNCCYTNCRFRSLIVAPLLPQYAENSLGMVTLFFDVPERKSSAQLATVEAFAQMMTAAIEHARINREARRNERIVARQNIANDIHDSLAQTLTYARMRTSLLQEAIRNGNGEMAAQYARDLDEALEIGQKSTRALIADFRCEMNAAGLLAGLKALTDEFRQRNDIVLEYHNRLVGLELPLEYEIQVYHIVREALNNIARHSGASHARLFVDSSLGYYVFTIEDNGSGASTFAPVEGHYGVLIMRERAQRIGGDLKVESAVGLGTQVQLYFPEPSSEWRAT